LVTWLNAATSIQRRTFWACFAGWSLDAFDTQLYSLAMPALIVSFGIQRWQAGLISSVTLVTGAVGGWLGGAVSDQYGRVRALQWAIAWFAVGSAFAATITDYSWLVAVKALQGFGFGAEWAAGVALVAETINFEDRGKAMGAVQSGWAAGWGLAVLIFGVIFSYVPEEIAWRLLFGIGVLPAVLVLIIQRSLVEPQRNHVRPPSTFSTTMVSIFTGGNLRSALAGALLGVGAHGGYYGLFTWLPTYLKSERGLTVMATSAYLGVIIVAFGTGCLVAGQLLDRVGRRATVAIYAVGCISLTAIYLLTPISGTTMLLLGFPLGFCAAGIPASLGTLFSELFPAGNRGTGIGFCYNFGRVASAIVPLLIGLFAEDRPLRQAIGLDVIVAYSVVLLALLLLPSARALQVSNQHSPLFVKN
jgi:MFS family permease